MILLCLLGFHDWGFWYIEGEGTEGMIISRRICIKSGCNKEQFRRVKPAKAMRMEGNTP